MMDKMMNKLIKKITKILLPVYIIVAIFSPVSAIAFADTGNSEIVSDFKYSANETINVGTTEVTDIGADALEDSWLATDFKYDPNDETIIIGFSTEGLNKLATNKDLVIPAQNVTGTAITAIGVKAFTKNKLTSVTFPDTIVTIGDAAFSSNSISGELKLPDNLSLLGKQAFMSNKNITHVEIPRGVTVINDGTFLDNSLTEVTIHNNIRTIGMTAFGTNQIETLVFEENRYNSNLLDGIDIQKSSFAKNNLKTVRLPYKVKGIASDAFANNLGNDPVTAKLVYLYTENPLHLATKTIFHFDAEDSKQKSTSAKLILEEKPWTAEDFTYDTTNATIMTGFSDTGINKLADNTVLEIPLKNKDGNTITAIATNAFANKGLTKVIFQEGLNEFTINAGAFMNNSISELTIPEGVRNFEAQCFRYNKITAVNFPQSTLKIGNGAFEDNKINSLTIADTKEKIQIDGTAFCNNQIKSFILPYRVEKLAGTAFLNNTGMESSPVDGSGIVYMYTSNANHFNADRIFRIGGKNISSYQKLILKDAEGSAEWEEKDFTYEGRKITGLSEDGKIKAIDNKNLVLPDVNPQGETITEIASNSFKMEAQFNENEVISPDGFTSVAFPKGLQIIGDNAFQYNNFKDLSFPDSLEHIGMMAFNGNKLTTLTLPTNLTTMGNGAFGINKLTTLEINHKLKLIPAGAFTANTTLTNLEIPEGVEEIGANAFRGAQLKTLVISSTVEKIGDSAFILHKLEALTIPGNVKYIGKQAFEGNLNLKTLKSLTLNEGLETISKGAFNKNLLTRVDIPSSVTALDKSSFVDNIGVTSGAVDVYTTKAAHKDFIADAKSHKIVYFNPQEMWTASDFTYEGTSLTGFTEEGKAKAVLYRYTILPDKNLEGENITRIAKEAFIPDGYEFIKEEVISPNGLNKVVLPKFLEVIEERAFQYNNLTTIEFPSSLTTLKQQCFNGNKLQKLIIPETIVNIEEGAFSTNKLTDVTLPSNIKVIPKGLFARNITLQYIEIPQGVEIIDEYAFNGAQLKTLRIPNSVTEIRRGAFYYHQIKELEIPSSVKVLGYRAFSGTTKAIRLEKLILNEGLEEIGAYAFAVSLLKEVNLPNSIDKLDASSFDHNTGFEDSGKVNLHTNNKNHLDFPKSESYIIIYHEPSSGGDNNSDNSGSSTVKTPIITLPKETSGGKVIISDDKRTIEIVADDGYEIADLIIDGKSVGALSSYKFYDDKEHTIEVVFKVKDVVKFTDINNHWAKDSINFVIAQGIFTGASDTEFAPNSSMTRSMLATVLYRYEKNPEIDGSHSSFKDVQGNSWYSDGIVWAAKANVVKGITSNSFAPNEKLTREQLITMLYRYAQHKGIDVTAKADLSSYNDSDKIADWSKQAMEWAVSTGLLHGKDNKMLAPSDGITRGEAAEILTRFIKEIL